MENNYNDVNDIINHFKKLLMKDNKLVFSKEDIYRYLTNYNITKKNYKEITEEDINFNNNNFENINYINDDTYLFTNNKNKIKINNPIKIYLPLKHTHIIESINKLLTFFNKKNIPFEMKITKSICNNNITIRLANIEDTNKFINFIKYNDYISEGLIGPNPFCYIEKNISFTIDGNLSYISIITDYLYHYLKTKNNSIEEINIDDFYNFIIDSYNNSFRNFSTYNNLTIPDIDNPTEQDIINYKNITEFLLKVSENNFTKNSFNEHFNSCNNKSISEQKNKFLALNTLINYISVEKQYKSDKDILQALHKYLETNNLSYITNVGFFRTTMYLSNFKVNIEKILNESNLSLEELINNLNVKPYQKLNDKEIEELLTQNNDLYKKVLSNDNIKLYLATNDYTLLSRKDNLRNTIVDSNFRNNLLNILFSKNISFKDFAEQYKNTNEQNDIEDELKKDGTIVQDSIDEETSEIIEKENKINIAIDENIIFENAIMDTYNKYQTLFEENKVECDGFSLVNYALTNAIKNNDFSSFTRDNNSRKNLVNLGSKKILEIICNKMEYKDVDIDNLENEELKHIVTKYLNQMYFESNNKRKGL